ncbi:omega-hydroxypalmitate O-feruloyl transferase-like [Neltuma alba]|uniref:omega-hydroxypalmitate O-feruloyl transferase-like n=1 Tax=Neltuma alba TaxID=207710 RepID=UPI0010A529CD|nr:omega-hydroxypalmitate O-feruloyl transferase-like [Prosopis alba]
MKAIIDDIELVEKIVICPEESTPNKRMFLSNIDLTLVAYQDSSSFFDPPSKQMSFSEICSKLYSALRQMLVHYDFMAGRLVPSSDGDRFEIDCNGAGIVVAAAKTDTELSEFGDMSVSNPRLKQLIGFLLEEDEEIDLKDKPLTSLQLTQFGCGSLALASHYNHCTLDGIAISDFEKNLAALTRGDSFRIIPNADRTFLKARNPLKISDPHYEYSKTTSTNSNNVFTSRGTSGIRITRPRSITENKVHVLHLSAQQVSSFKKNAMMKQNTLKNISSFQVVAVRIWKARSFAMKMPEEEISTMLFPVEVRKWIVPELQEEGFAGNALVPGFARATVKELREEDDVSLIRKVKEGIERIDEEYVRSGIDWLEENRGVPCSENSFSLVAWMKLGLEDQEFAWGRVKCATPLELKPGLVMMLPATEGDGGLNICLDLPEDQMQEFCRIMLEV